MICKRLVQLMAGEIWCESTPGEGTVFCFTAQFMVAEDLATQAADTCNDDPECQGQNADSELAGLRILLAEDNEINQMIALELLNLKGCVVDVAGTGQEALDLLQKNTYALVLMDIQMPVMDGLTATKTIRKNPLYGDLPIIAMTAHAMSGDRELSLETGMNDHITKPIDPESLYTAIKKWTAVS